MGKIFAIIRGLFVILTMLIFMGLYSLRSIFVKHTMKRALRLRERWIKYMSNPLMGLSIDFEGELPIEPSIIISNHRSFVDPLVLCRHIKAAVVAKAEIADYPVINKGAEMTGIVWVDRSNKDSRAAVRQAIADTIASGHNVLIFPEGTISRLKHTLPIRPGSFVTALKHNIPVVPVALDFKDPRDMWTIPNILKQYLKQFGKLKTSVKVRIGQPVPATSVEEMVAYTEQWMADTLDSIQKDWSEVIYDEKA